MGIFTVPSAIAFLLFGPLITHALFFGISANDSQYLGNTLAGFALGLLPLSVNLIALRGLNAFENVKLQVISNALMNAIAIAISLILAAVLPAKWVTVGLAGALSVSYFVGAWCTLRLLRRYEVNIHVGETVGFYLKLVVVALLIAVPMRFLVGYLPGGNTIHLLFVLGVSGVGYIVFAKLLGITEVASAIQLLRKGRVSG